MNVCQELSKFFNIQIFQVFSKFSKMFENIQKSEKNLYFLILNLVQKIPAFCLKARRHG